MALLFTGIFANSWGLGSPLSGLLNHHQLGKTRACLPTEGRLKNISQGHLLSGRIVQYDPGIAFGVLNYSGSPSPSSYVDLPRRADLLKNHIS